MADSRRLIILKAITTQLETVATTAGYQYDLLGKVFRGRVDYGTETEAPWVGLFELRPEENLIAGETLNRDEWQIGVQGVVAADELHPTDPAHRLMADVKKAIGQVMVDDPRNRDPNYMLGGLVHTMKMDGGLTFVPKENADLAVFALRLTIAFPENLEDPYE